MILVLVLGALPLKDEAHLETLTQATLASNGFNRVTAVLTLNKPFELEPSMAAGNVFKGQNGPITNDNKFQPSWCTAKTASVPPGDFTYLPGDI